MIRSRRSWILTPAQRRVVAALMAAGARSLQLSVKPADLAYFNGPAFSVLRDRGLADVYDHRPTHGDRHRRYWLTNRGLEAAERLQEARGG